MKRRLVSSLVVAVLAAALAAPSFAATNPSQNVFKQNCAGCHTLAAAKAKGSVGPNLDKRKPKLAIVVARVTNGKGAMPSFKGRLKSAQIQALAKWLTANYKK